MSFGLPPEFGVRVPEGLVEALRQPPLPNYIVRCADGRVAGVVHPYAPPGKAILMGAAMSVEDFDEFVTEGRSLPHRREWHAAQRVVAAAKAWASPVTVDQHAEARCEHALDGLCLVLLAREQALRDAVRTMP